MATGLENVVTGVAMLIGYGLAMGAGVALGFATYSITKKGGDAIIGGVRKRV